MGFLADFFENIVYEASNLWVQIFSDLGRVVFYIEESDTIGGMLDAIQVLFDFVRILAIGLIILKVLKKGFFTYILWRDGDPDLSIQQAITNTSLAVIAALFSNVLYEWFADISLWILEKVSFLSFDLIEINSWIEVLFSFLTKSSLLGIVVLIYLIMLFVLYLQFLARSAALLVLRIGFPLATLGLLDSDNGVFSTTIKIFIQLSLTTIAQLFFMMLSISIYLNSILGSSLINPFICIACCSAAFNIPKLLDKILLTTGGSGVGSKVNTASQAVSLVRNVLGK